MSLNLLGYIIILDVYSRIFKLCSFFTNIIWHNSKYNWMVECQEEFNKVKYVLTHAPMLALPTFSKLFEVICDAFIVGIGAILLQK